MEITKEEIERFFQECFYNRINKDREIKLRVFCQDIPEAENFVKEFNKIMKETSKTWINETT